MMRLALWLALAGAFAVAHAAPPAAPTFQELMDPAKFPDPQRGMVVESVAQKGDRVRVVTTGAEIVLAEQTGTVTFSQRIGHQRPLARLELGTRLRGLQVTHSGAGFARVQVAEPKVTIRINGDSLFMLHVHEPIVARVDRDIEVAWHGSAPRAHLLADEWGAFCVYTSAQDGEDHFDPFNTTVTHHRLPADAVLWLAVCPPKPYPWERSLQDNVVWHWSNSLGYPPDDVLRRWKPFGNTVLLQSEVMLWKDWNLDFVPRLGPSEFARVRKTLHGMDMRFIVYTSPFYFLRGTSLEPRALNSFEGFTGWPPGTGTGENMGLFMEAIGRVMKEHKPDGLYFDGQYTGNAAALYALARQSRALVGEEGILEWHSTHALGNRHCYLPQADAYVDFVLRGEGRQAMYQDLDYLRFFVSGYNVSNSIGVLCNNGPPGLTSDVVRDILSVNGRLHTIAGWLSRPELVRILQNEYFPRLTPALRQAVDAGVDARQQEVASKAESYRQERNAIRQSPAWTDPVFELTFDQLPKADRLVSPTNPDPFRIEDKELHIRGHGNTFAYLRIPLKVRANGMVLKLRHGTDRGMSWGPAAALCWPNRQMVRIGTRDAGEVQADITGQQFHGYAHDAQAWTWMRVRWLKRLGVVELSKDGRVFEPLWTFEHGGTLNAKTARLLVGKVPYNGQPKDHSVPGELGESAIAWVRIYGER